MGRIQFLDGLRGIAIGSVVLFHAYGSWPQWLPFGDRFIVAPFRFGYIGVNLFFLISGFVILMTLERCGSLKEFAWRRWIRLFPTMLVASIIILAFDILIGSGPLSDRQVIDLIPGLAFLSPYFIHALTGAQLQSMDDTFWSLYVEVSFYAVAGISFFVGGRRWVIWIVIAIFAASLGISIAGIGKLAYVVEWMGFLWFGWFASGALFYIYFSSKTHASAVAALALGIFSAVVCNSVSLPDQIALIVVVILFYLSLRFAMLQQLLSNRSLLFLGSISYPLYLVHNNIMVGLERDFAGRFPWVPDFLIPIAPICVVVALAFAILLFAEKPFHQWIRSYRTVSAS